MKKNGNLKKMISLYKPYKFHVLLVLFGCILGSAVDLFWPIITRKILNECVGKPWSDVKILMMQCGIGLVACLLATIVSQWIASERCSILTDYIKYDLQKKIFWKFQNQSFSYFDEIRVGDVTTLLDYDVSKIDEFIYHLPSHILPLVINIIGAIVIFSTMSPILLVSMLPIIVLALISNRIQSKRTTEAYKKLRADSKERISNAEDKISGVRTIQSFGKGNEESLAFNQTCDDEFKSSKHVWRLTFIRNACNGIFNNLLYITMVIGGSYLVSTNRMSLGDLTIFLMYSYMIENPIREISGISRMYNKAVASFDQITELLNKEVVIANPQDSLSPAIEGNVTLDNVSFRYECENDEYVISDLSLEAKAGKFVAIVGPSGSGKSTIAGLIPRYYDVNRGSVKIDGINVKDFNVEYLRKNVGVVQQDIYLFYGSIYDNIAYAKPGASEDEIIEAAKLANAHDFISDLPNGYNSNIGDRGVKLSGGQKQRIAIARIFLENPPIVIFDEATSALDNESEKKVQKAMENLSEKRTTIVIAHRLSTIKNADEIYFLTKNGIEEHGSHKYLMDQNGKYAELYKASEK